MLESGQTLPHLVEIIQSLAKIAGRWSSSLQTWPNSPISCAKYPRLFEGSQIWPTSPELKTESRLYSMRYAEVIPAQLATIGRTWSY